MDFTLNKLLTRAGMAGLLMSSFVSHASADNAVAADPVAPTDDDAWTVTTKAVAGNHLTAGGLSVGLPAGWGSVGGIYANQSGIKEQTQINYKLPVQVGQNTTLFSLSNSSASAVKTQFEAGCYEGGLYLKDLNVGTCLGTVSYQKDVPGVTTNLGQAGANLNAYPAAIATQLKKINYKIPAVQVKGHMSYSKLVVQYAPTVASIKVSDDWNSNVKIVLQGENGYERKASAGVSVDLVSGGEAANARDIVMPRAPGQGTKVAVQAYYEQSFNGSTYQNIVGQKEKPQVVTALKASTEIFGETLGHRMSVEAGVTGAAPIKSGAFMASAGFSVSYHFN